MNKKDNYLCIRCGFNTKIKNDIRRHFYNLKKICPATKNNVELSNEIKEYILNNRIYIIPKQELQIQRSPNKICNDLLIIKNDISKLNKDLPVNNQLINIILDKDKKLQELLNNETIKNESLENKLIKEEIIVNYQSSLVLNNITILSRLEDNYINATQLCQAGNKKYSQWISLNTTKELINELESEDWIPASPLIDSKKGNSSNFEQEIWIHPILAIQLAQWISPKFSLQVSKWIILLFSNRKVEINKTMMEEMKMKDKKIKLLQDTYLKKHKRIDYPEKNVIYILTTEENKKNRIYIIGKTIDLKNRLSVYNKTTEHEVIYYKECINEDVMTIIENMILLKLTNYREIANRDRFVLPIEKDINYFIDIVNNCINFIN